VCERACAACALCRVLFGCAQVKLTDAFVDSCGIPRLARNGKAQAYRAGRWVALALAVGFIALSGAASASADDVRDLSRSDIAQTVGIYEATVPDVQSGADAAAPAEPPVDVPADPSDGVVIGVGDDVLRVIPDHQNAAGDEIVLADGTSIYPGASPEIRTANAEYPIVADPRFERHLYWFGAFRCGSHATKPRGSTAPSSTAITPPAPPACCAA